ncbi:MAG: PepSY-like domain-containing protein [Flavobacteriales bacterium]|nr:PepSY-like domain-containing protein [Flavobacteriales bacterium]MCC6937794.1 PepSY-like domain-containing protein [Flavobacteriales bacterium]
MKNLIPTLLALAVTASACAQKPATIVVPEAVKAAFAEQFPKAEGTAWEMESKTEYEAGFKMGGMKYSAVFTAEGKWMETEHKIKTDALPETVKKAIATNYADHKVEGAEQVERADGTFYEVDLEKGETEIEVLFNADGKVMKTKVEEEDKDSPGEDDDND